jgi:hypothetical protein
MMKIFLVDSNGNEVLDELLLLHCLLLWDGDPYNVRNPVALFPCGTAQYKYYNMVDDFVDQPT